MIRAFKAATIRNLRFGVISIILSLASDYDEAAYGARLQFYRFWRYSTQNCIFSRAFPADSMVYARVGVASRLADLLRRGG